MMQETDPQPPAPKEREAKPIRKANILDADGDKLTLYFSGNLIMVSVEDSEGCAVVSFPADQFPHLFKLFTDMPSAIKLDGGEVER
jgi:hypothetical protein